MSGQDDPTQVKIFVQWPFGDQLFGFGCYGKFLGAKLF